MHVCLRLLAQALADHDDAVLTMYPELFSCGGAVGYLPKYFSVDVTESEQRRQGTTVQPQYSG